MMGEGYSGNLKLSAGILQNINQETNEVTLGTEGISFRRPLRNSSSPSTKRCRSDPGVNFVVTK